MTIPNPLNDDTLSQILVCRRAKYGCTWVISYELGGAETAHRVRIDHEDNLCPFRHFKI